MSAQYHGGYGGHESHGGYAGLGGYSGGHGGYSGGHGGYDDHSHVDYYVSISLFSLKIIKLKIGWIWWIKLLRILVQGDQAWWIRDLAPGKINVQTC